MPKAIRIHRNGGPEVPAWEEIQIGAPAGSEEKCALARSHGAARCIKDAAQAHRDLEARRTTGSTVLLP